jgi:hypothetical protein
VQKYNTIETEKAHAASSSSIPVSRELKEKLHERRHAHKETKDAITNTNDASPESKDDLAKQDGSRRKSRSGMSL